MFFWYLQLSSEWFFHKAQSLWLWRLCSLSRLDFIICPGICKSFNEAWSISQQLESSFGKCGCSVQAIRTSLFVGSVKGITCSPDLSNMASRRCLEVKKLRLQVDGATWGTSTHNQKPPVFFLAKLLTIGYCWVWPCYELKHFICLLVNLTSFRIVADYFSAIPVVECFEYTRKRLSLFSWRKWHSTLIVWLFPHHIPPPPPTLQ